MALATRCPNCQAMFRVVSDQLKLRGGLVRCGNCRHVFDAIGSLSYIEDASLALAPPKRGAPTDLPAESAAASAMPPAANRAALPEAVAAVVPPGGGDAPGDAASALAPPAPRAEEREQVAPPTPRPSQSTVADTPVDPLAVPTLLAPNAGRDGAVDAEAQADRATTTDRTDASAAETQATGLTQSERDDDAVSPPEAERGDDAAAEVRRARRGKSRRRSGSAADTAGDAEGLALDDAAAEPAPEPAFLRESRRPRGFSIVFGGGSLLLALLLLLQSAVMFRTELVTRWPQLRPQLVTLCDLYGCNVGWPTRAELLAVVGTELQAVPGTDILELTAVVRNRASFRVALPAVEVTLTDTTNRTLARKVFAPVDYLASSGEPSSRISEGLGAGSDYVVKIVFEARGLNAAGFVVYPFYL